MNQIQRLAIGSWVLAAGLLAMGCAATPGRITQKDPVPVIDAPGGAGLEGYDAVAYFTDHMPVPGTDACTYTWQGATWKFASAEHRDLFAANPEHYAPQYGGYCAYAMSRGATVHADPNQWAVVHDRLFVNANAIAKSLWDHNRSGKIRAADQNWPLIPKRDAPSQATDGSPQGTR